MSEVPIYVGAISVAGTVGILASTCVILYKGSLDNGVNPRKSALGAATAAVVLAAWATGSALFAQHGGYHTQLGKQPPWLPLEAVAAIVTLLFATRIPYVARALSGPASARRFLWPHVFRVAGISFVISMLLGDMPALFAVPAGLGDIAVGLAEPLVARRVRSRQSNRAEIWLNVLGLIDLLTAMILGGLTAFQIVHVSPVNSAIGAFPLALTPTVGVPVLFALHVLTLRRSRSSAIETRRTSSIRAAEAA
jgi:hypothetical protein